MAKDRWSPGYATSSRRSSRALAVSDVEAADDLRLLTGALRMGIHVEVRMGGREVRRGKGQRPGSVAGRRDGPEQRTGVPLAVQPHLDSVDVRRADTVGRGAGDGVVAIASRDVLV